MDKLLFQKKAIREWVRNGLIDWIQRQEGGELKCHY